MPRRPKRTQRGLRFGDSVFVNCPFDPQYWPLFEAVIFTVYDCGFVPRSALELTDSGTVRLHELRDLIRSCKYAIHDLSRVQLGQTGLPRFNMPFELGLDLGARLFGSGRQTRKQCLIFEGDPFSLQKSLSDVAGQEIVPHRNSPSEVVTAVRNWLQGTSLRRTVPGPEKIRRRFTAFSDALPDLAAEAGLNRRALTFIDYAHLVEEWLRAAI